MAEKGGSFDQELGSLAAEQLKDHHLRITDCQSESTESKERSKSSARKLDLYEPKGHANASNPQTGTVYSSIASA